MLRVHTRDGKTHKFDVESIDGAKEWGRLMGDPAFQSQITGVTLARDGTQYTVARPSDLEPIFFHVEGLEADGRAKGGERATLYAGDVRVSMMVHAAQRAARVSVTRMGKQRFNPYVGRG